MTGGGAPGPPGHCWHLCLATRIPIISKVQRTTRVWDVSGTPDTIKNTVWNQTFMADGGWGEVSALIPGIASESKKKKKWKIQDQMHEGQRSFQSLKPEGFFLSLTSSKAEKNPQIHVCKLRRYVKELIWTVAATGEWRLFMFAGIWGRHHNWDSVHVTGLSVYARGSFPRRSSQTRTESEFTNYPSREHSRAETCLRLGHSEMHSLQSIWRVWFMTEWDRDRRAFDFKRCSSSGDCCSSSSHGV